MGDLTWLMIVVAIIPPIIIMLLIYAKDKHDKEPPGLLFKCAIFGAISVVFSLILEMITMQMIPEIMHTNNSIAYYAVLAFLGIAAVEETGKYLALRLATWRNRNFNYTFDGIVYSVYASLGFALVENIVYVIKHGMNTGLLRAVTAIPGHASFGVYMGFFYGYAKFYEVAGNQKKKRSNLWLGWLTAVLLHGFYDFFALSGTKLTIALYFVFIVAVDIIVIIQVFRSAKNDTPIYQAYQQPVYQMQFRQVYQNPYYAQQMQGAYRAPVYLQQQYGMYPQGNVPMQPGAGAANPYMPPQNGVGAANPYMPPQGGAGAANPYMQPQSGVGAVNPYMPPQNGVGAVNPYMQPSGGVRPGNPYAQQAGGYTGQGINQAQMTGGYGNKADSEGETGELRR